MRAPHFWWRAEAGAAARALSPLAALYGAVAGARMARLGRSVGVPVLCVGNPVVGGAGKTPTVLALVDRLAAMGRRPAVVSRGYGGSRRRGVAHVDSDRDAAATVGDEPLLLARAAPCFVSPDRLAAAAAARAAGATVVIMDDGLQNPALAKDASIAAVDGGVGIGNGRVFPAGPLRAPLGRQWPSIDLVLVIGPGAPGDAVADEAVRHGVPVTRGRLVADAAAIAALRGRRLLAFSGIGRPGKFFATLDEADLAVVGRIGFPDHHRYSERDCARLVAAARDARAELLTTEKDHVRLPAAVPALVLPVRLEIADPAPLDALLSGLVSDLVSDRG